MRFAHVYVKDPARPDTTTPQLAVIKDDHAIVLYHLVEAGFLPRQLRRLNDLILAGDRGLAQVATAVEGWEGKRTPIEKLKFAPAVLQPPTIIAIGLNYAEHFSELGFTPDKTPTVFTLWPNSLAGHEQTVEWSAELSNEVDYEGELGVILGEGVKDVSREEALSKVWGYTVVNDITARDVQTSEAQWSRSKSFDSFTPAGPYIVTADEIPDPQDLHITTVVNGQTVQDASTGLMVYPIAELIYHLSKHATLLPGTLISTGSPGGSGKTRTPQVFLKDGSTVTVTIDGIGSLTSTCKVVD